MPEQCITDPAAPFFRIETCSDLASYGRIIFSDRKVEVGANNAVADAGLEECPSGSQDRQNTFLAVNRQTKKRGHGCHITGGVRRYGIAHLPAVGIVPQAQFQRTVLRQGQGGTKHRVERKVHLQVRSPAGIVRASVFTEVCIPGTDTEPDLLPPCGITGVVCRMDRSRHCHTPEHDTHRKTKHCTANHTRTRQAVQGPQE